MDAIALAIYMMFVVCWCIGIRYCAFLDNRIKLNTLENWVGLFLILTCLVAFVKFWVCVLS